MKKPVAFDWDGTLFQVHLMSVPAFITVFSRLAEQGIIDSMPGEAKFKSIYGMTGKEIWEYLLPGAGDQLKEKVARWIREEEEKIKERGKLFPGARETLEALANMGHPLFVVSNGTEEYVKWACASTGLAPLLTGIYSAGQYKTETKVELLAHAIDEHGLEPGYMVGDRSSDIAAGLGNGFTAVGCTYGYGSRAELEDAHHIIDHISEILDLVRKE
jgi:phosphoglycolate phosphatase